MIDVKELRIGNWFIGGWKGDSYLKVNGGYLSSWTHSGYISGSFPEPNPIPLTPEILEKAGFNNYRYWWTRAGDAFNFEQWTAKSFGLYLHVNEHKVGQHIIYVHQFQNLIFALTGSELEINL